MGDLRRWGAALCAVVGLGSIAVACGSGNRGAPLTDDAVLTSGEDANAAGAGGAGNASSTSLSAGDRFLAEYAGAICAMYQPCCQAEGAGFNADGCIDWFARVSAAYLPDEFVPEAGAACLAAVSAARAQDPERCSTVAVFDDASLRDLCGQAFVAPAREGAALGERCMLAGDCAAPGGGAQVTCYGRMCVSQRRGSAGEGPCYAGGNVGVAQEMFTCDAADGLYCDRASNVCAPRVGDGERCAYATACSETALCVGGTCRELPGEGEPCLNAVPGAGGFCRSGACNVATLTCGPGAAEGEACSDTRKCESGVCISGSCARSDWQRNLNCTGRATSG